MTEDLELLRRYAAEQSEAAFAELTRRHVDLVYSAALRLLYGDVPSAQDVTQQVFTEVARQAKRLARHPALVKGYIGPQVRTFNEKRLTEGPSHLPSQSDLHRCGRFPRRESLQRAGRVRDSQRDP